MWAYYISIKPGYGRFDIMDALPGDILESGKLSFRIRTAQEPTFCFKARGGRLPEDIKKRFYYTESNAFAGVTEVDEFAPNLNTM